MISGSDAYGLWDRGFLLAPYVTEVTIALPRMEVERRAFRERSCTGLAHPAVDNRPMADELPTGRFQRLARFGAAAAGQAARQAGTRAANVGRSEERASAAMERRQLEAAEQIVTVLGGMKGAAMKMGQVLSFVDLGVVPARVPRAASRRSSATLRDAAPTVSFEQMRTVIESDLERPLAEVFPEFDPEPIAAASIGQVYRATLPDGRDVAVKVQYPGINDAVRADMKNLGVLLRLMRVDHPAARRQGGRRPRSASGSSRSSTTSSRHRTSGRWTASTTATRSSSSPSVVTSLCRERVIVTELVSGDGFETLRQEPDEERDRIGEIVFRFYFGSMYRHRGVLAATRTRAT